MRRKGLKAYGAAVADLRPRHGQIIVGGSNHPRSPRVAGRKREQEPNPEIPEGQWQLYLAHLLESRGFTPDQLATHLGKTRSVVFKWLRGDSVPHISEWGKIAAFLGLKDWRSLVPPDTFLRKLGDK